MDTSSVLPTHYYEGRNIRCLVDPNEAPTKCFPACHLTNSKALACYTAMIPIPHLLPLDYIWGGTLWEKGKLVSSVAHVTFLPFLLMLGKLLQGRKIRIHCRPHIPAEGARSSTKNIYPIAYKACLDWDWSRSLSSLSRYFCLYTAHVIMSILMTVADMVGFSSCIAWDVMACRLVDKRTTQANNT
ncbi:hypothetical protein J3A83DRAFT_445187 [Scleroderma citrinum]